MSLSDRRAITIKLSPEQHKALRMMAVEDGTTMQAIVMQAIKREIGRPTRGTKTPA